MAPVITFMTDFGLSDGYVASMKGVVLQICPEARLIDITHLIPPQDIRAAAFVLSTVYRHFPKGTVHVAVVDPGVGTERRGVAVNAAGCLFVGPDNGLFSLIIKDEPQWRANSLEAPRFRGSTVSPTFHGRDIFAPVAAHLALGVDMDELGPRCDLHLADWGSITRLDNGLEGRIIHIDHFGNAITNITQKDLKAFASPDQVHVRTTSSPLLHIRQTYGKEKPGGILALFGSSGYLEIAVNQGSAAKTLGLASGDPVWIDRRIPEPPPQ